MHFLLDENVPRSVADTLRGLGHDVTLVTDILIPGTTDPVVATTAESLGAVLISADRGFRLIGPRLQIGRGRFRKLSRIALRCNEPQAAQRIEKAMDLIESEYEIAQESHDMRLIIEIGNHHIRTER